MTLCSIISLTYFHRWAKMAAIERKNIWLLLGKFLNETGVTFHISSKYILEPYIFYPVPHSKLYSHFMLIFSLEVPLVQCGRVFQSLCCIQSLHLFTLPVPSLQMCFCLFTFLVLRWLYNSTPRCWTLYWWTDCSTHIFLLLAWLLADRPHVMMSQPSLRSLSRIAPHQHSGSSASSPKDSSPMAPGSTASLSKVSPHMTPLPPLTSQSPPPPSSQPPHRRARSITPPPQSNGPLSSGPAIPPH
jgi:hypothetical protein